MDLIDEFALIGGAILSAQRLEFALYGIVSHLSHLPEVQKDKRFRDLIPEKFLRGDVDDLKATFGQLETIVGERLLISTDELKKLIKDRNLIAHNYWRLTKANIKDGEKLSNPEDFLKDFLARCDMWERIFRGFLYIFMMETAKKFGRESEINFSEQQKKDIQDYYALAAIRLITHLS